MAPLVHVRSGTSRAETGGNSAGIGQRIVARDPARKGLDRASHRLAHGSINWSPALVKSRMLRVATAIPRDCAMAAIAQSIGLMGRQPSGASRRCPHTLGPRRGQMAISGYRRPRAAVARYRPQARRAAGLPARWRHHSATPLRRRSRRTEIPGQGLRPTLPRRAPATCGSVRIRHSRPALSSPQSKRGGSRIGPRGGSSSSTPP